MAAKAGSKRAGDPGQKVIGIGGRARRGTDGRHLPRGEGAPRATLPTMHASARRRGVASDARRPRKGKQTRLLGGRLAAAIRTARLRAGRAAEEFGLRR